MRTAQLGMKPGVEYIIEFYEVDDEVVVEYYKTED